MLFKKVQKVLLAFSLTALFSLSLLGEFVASGIEIAVSSFQSACDNISDGSDTSPYAFKIRVEDRKESSDGTNGLPEPKIYMCEY